MSIFLRIQFTAQREHLRDLEQALTTMAAHVQAEHPRVLSTQCLRLRLGGASLPTFEWMEEFESLTSMEEAESKEYTPGCDEVWNTIYQYALPGTLHQEIWRDTLREAWMNR